ncbi:MAG TPA: DUF4160 domain-containing protein [Candidatus Absconditabacterales bacterium]|nr:DUF4160 domain-containing protein [Candidatus Absconditabacterales bacterium]HMT27207.1 DUF4160 domain-containing protein [Candidatus Absconditabacterales bacterium]
MPQLSSFYGISISIYFADHNPPHFHATYGEFEALFDLRTIGILQGWLPPKAHTLVVEWAALHQKELEENWQTIQKDGTYNKIQPLE